MYVHPEGRPVAGAVLLGVGAAEELVVGTPSTTGVEEADFVVVPGVVEVDLIVDEGVVEDDDLDELILTGTAPVPGAWYMSSLYGPPQNSDEFPLQTILQPETPSGAGPPPPVKELAQSWRSVSMEY